MLLHKTCCIEILIKYTHRKDIAYLSLEENVKERFVIVRLIFLYSFPSYLTFYEITSCFFKETSRIWKVFLKFDSIWDLAYD